MIAASLVELMGQTEGLGGLLRNRGGIGMRVANAGKRTSNGNASLLVLAPGVPDGTRGHLDA